ncbi:MAG: hypothetical protein HY078_09450 [Elusimicrobia bacterium]|nr:hypothetical protein [Elusimicrobiota bacterium]
MSDSWPNAAPAYLDLRGQFLRKTPEEMGLAALAASQPVCAAGVDLSFPDGVATVVGLADGNASMYFGGGGGVIGGFAHEKTNSAARRLCEVAGRSLAAFSATDDAPLPAKPGWINFYLRTNDALLRAAASEAELKAGHPLSDLFLAAHDVITGLREISQAQDGAGGAEARPANAEGIGRASVDLHNMVLDALQAPNGQLHAETAIGLAAGLAGAFLLLELHGEEVRTLAPGSVVVSEEINQASPHLVRYLVDLEEGLGIKGEALKAIPKENLPTLSPEDIAAKFVSRAAAVCGKYKLTPNEATQAAVDNAANLVKEVSRALPPSIANAIAVHYITNCAMTAPALAP